MISSINFHSPEFTSQYITNQIFTFENKAINWIYKNLNNFSRLLDDNDLQFHLKILGELSVLSSFFRFKYTYENYKINKIQKFVQKRFDNDVYIAEIIRNPRLSLFSASTLYSYLKSETFKMEKLEYSLNVAFNLMSPILSQLSRARIMDLCYSFNRIGLSHNLPTLVSLFKKTILHREFNIVLLNESEVYSITHILFYLTNFGLKKLEKDLQNKIPFINWIISILLGKYLCERNWDLVAELLICCQCLNFYPNFLYSTAWKNLISVQNKDGSIPFSSVVKKKTDTINKDLELYNVKRNYHSTLVSILASLTSTHKDNIDYSKYEINVRSNLLKETKMSLENAYSWICSNNFSNDSSSILYHALSLWIYYNINGYNKDSFSGKMNEIKKKLEGMQNFESLKVDPKLALIFTGMLRKLNLKCLPLEEFVNQISEICNRSPEFLENIEFIETKFLLYKLGLLPKNEISSIHHKDLKLNNAFFDERIFNQVLSYTTALTLFGKNSITNTDLSLYLSTILNIKLIQCLCNYNIAVASNIIRIISYLRLPRIKSFQHSLQYFLSQQQIDGKYGYYNKEIKQIKQKKTNYNEIETLYLPITFSALWCLAELTNRRFILYQSI
jgi:hypothetical protein